MHNLNTFIARARFGLASHSVMPAKLNLFDFKTRITDFPYSDRRIIVVQDDASFAHAAFGFKDAEKLRTSSAEAAGFGLLGVIGALAVPALAPAIIGGALVSGASKSSGGKSNDFPNALAVPRTLAQNQLVFPSGGPEISHAYAGHPLVANRYLPVASFHPALFEDKVNELAHVLASLGALQTKIICRKGYRTTKGGSAGIKAKGIDLSAETKSDASNNAAMELEETYRPVGQPRVPTDLVWYGQEPSWQALAKRRLEHNTRSFRIVLHYDNNYGIDGSLTLGLEKVGVNLGGSFTEFESTEWEFSGEFQ